jgi:hypothetical protein
LEISGRKWASAALLSILIPISLLATSRFTGILQEPLTPEVTEAETVNWSIARPADYKRIDEKVTSLYSGNGADIKFTTQINEYEENTPELPFEGNDGLNIRLTAAANVNNGYIHSATIQFLDQSNGSIIHVSGDPNWRTLQNAEIDRIEDWQPEAYIRILAVGTPQHCLVVIPSYWIFFDLNSVNHHMTISLHVTYSDGVSYQEAVLPIHLEVNTV